MPWWSALLVAPAALCVAHGAQEQERAPPAQYQQKNTRNSYELFNNYKARNARICNPDVEECDPMQGAVSKQALERLWSLDKNKWPRHRPLEVAALG